jgi:hypothetical protein
MTVVFHLLIITVAITTFARFSSGFIAQPTKNFYLRFGGINDELKLTTNKVVFSRGFPTFMMTEKDEDEHVVTVKKEGKLQALWSKYGAFYFQVWFSIYLPFLLAFFYILDNNLLKSSVIESIDPQAAVLRLFSWLEHTSNNPELLSGLRGNPRVTTFATAYLLADLVPTTVFALAVVTFILRQREKDTADLIKDRVDIEQ